MIKPLVYGASWCSFCHALTNWLNQNKIDFDFIDVDSPGKREEMVSKTNGNQTIPVLFVGEEFWVKPDIDTLNELFILGRESQEEAAVSELKADEKLWDVVMVGAGPASLASAVYTAREDLSTLIIEKSIVGGLAAITDMVDNYPGFPEGIEGMKLADNLEAQAKRFGATIELDEVQSISKEGDIFTVKGGMAKYKARSVLIGTGSEWKKLGIPGEQEFYGKGVHNCATCDGAFYRDRRLVVVGGGNSSAQEALFLTRFASHIDILIRGAAWKASDVLVHEIEANDKITVHFNTTTDEIVGEDNKITKVIGTKDGVRTEFETDGVFVFIGLKPVTYYLDGSGVELDEFGFVKTDDHLATNVPGVFCAGDVRSGATMQIASAVGEGAEAALSIRKYLETK